LYIAEDVVPNKYVVKNAGWRSVTAGWRAVRWTVSGPPSRPDRKENGMSRKYIDCRDYPQSPQKCTVAISADSVDEVVEAAVEHGVKVHGYEDTAELRKQMQAAVKQGSPRP
jgi:predicted small metal-binding protein